MTAEPVDLAAVQAEHAEVPFWQNGQRVGSVCDSCVDEEGAVLVLWPCLPYRLAALALDLQVKVARVEALPALWMSMTEEGRVYALDHWRGRDYVEGRDWATETCAEELRAALADQPEQEQP